MQLIGHKNYPQNNQQNTRGRVDVLQDTGSLFNKDQQEMDKSGDDNKRECQSGGIDGKKRNPLPDGFLTAGNDKNRSQ
jgi:hypothetical protein